MQAIDMKSIDRVSNPSTEVARGSALGNGPVVLSESDLAMVGGGAIPVAGLWAAVRLGAVIGVCIAAYCATR